MTRRHARLILLCVPALALPAGCGDDAPAVRARDDRITVQIVDFRYRPQTIRASPGGLTFTLVNKGRLAHTFRVSRANTTIAKVSSLLPGDTATKRVKVGRGEYRFFCALSNHEELGMYGTLIVK